MSWESFGINKLVLFFSFVPKESFQKQYKKRICIWNEVGDFPKIPKLSNFYMTENYHLSENFYEDKRPDQYAMIKKLSFIDIILSLRSIYNFL